MISSPHSVTCLPFTQNPYSYYLKHFAGRDSVGNLRISCNEEESRRVSFLGGGQGNRKKYLGMVGCAPNALQRQRLEASLGHTVSFSTA